MVSVTYIQANGQQHAVDLANGTNLMEGAVKNGVPGILGDCGGAAACATCHIYIRADWQPVVGEISELETELLECSTDVTSESRLACQIVVSPQLDGVVIQIPESQD